MSIWSFLKKTTSFLVLEMLLSFPVQGHDASLARAYEIRIEIMKYWKTQDQESAEALYAEIGRLVVDSPDNSDLVRMQGAMTVGMAIMYAGAREFSKAEAMYRNVAAIRRRFSDNSQIAWAQAQLAEVLSELLQDDDSHEKAEMFRNDVRELSDLWPEDTGITLIRRRIEIY